MMNEELSHGYLYNTPGAKLAGVYICIVSRFPGLEIAEYATIETANC